MAYEPLRGMLAANIFRSDDGFRPIPFWDAKLELNESHFVRRSSIVHSLKMKCAQHCIQKLRQPK